VLYRNCLGLHVQNTVIFIVTISANDEIAPTGQDG
jgi:hypothetical protein